MASLLPCIHEFPNWERVKLNWGFFGSLDRFSSLTNKGKERQEWERDTTAARGQSPAPPLLSFTPLENGCAEGAAGHFVITVAINNNSSSASGHGPS